MESCAALLTPLCGRTRPYRPINNRPQVNNLPYKTGDSQLENSLLSYSNQLASIAEQSGPAIAGVHSDPRTAASGVHWRPGVIVTAAHALRREDDIRVNTSSGAALKAEVAGRDPGSDLAVLKVSGFY